MSKIAPWRLKDLPALLLSLKAFKVLFNSFILFTVVECFMRLNFCNRKYLVHVCYYLTFLFFVISMLTCVK